MLRPIAISLLVPAAAQAKEHDRTAKETAETAAAVIQEAVVSAGQDSAAVVQPDAESSDSVTTNVRESTVINDPQAPTRYDYKIDAPEGVVLTRLTVVLFQLRAWMGRIRA